MELEKNEFVIKKGIEVCEATKLLEKRRILYQIDEAFNNQVEEYNKKMEKFKKQEEKIKKMDLRVQEDFLKFSKFLNETKNKRKRAIKHFEDERKFKEKKILELEEENKLIELLEKHKKLFEKKIKQMVQYEKYLQTVVNKNPEHYNDINELLQRFNILKKSNKKLKGELFEIEEKQKDLDNSINKFEKTKNDQIIMMNNEITSLQKKLENVEMKYNKAQDNIDSSEFNNVNKMQLLSKMMLSIDNIYTIAQASQIKIRFDQSEINENFDEFRKKKDQISCQMVDEYQYNIKGYSKKLDFINANSDALQNIYELINKFK